MDLDVDTMINTYNSAVTDSVGEILGKERCRKKLWVTRDVLDLCDERGKLKKRQYEAEEEKNIGKLIRIQKAVKKPKKDWVGAQCEKIKICLN